MSAGKDLLKQFAQENTSANLNKQSNILSELLGITAINMVNTITSDISTMIDKGLTKELKGYILCLSRIMKHDIAWEYIQDSFKNCNEKIPQKYYELFGQDPSKLPKQKGMKVS